MPPPVSMWAAVVVLAAALAPVGAASATACERASDRLEAHDEAGHGDVCRGSSGEWRCPGD